MARNIAEVRLRAKYQGQDYVNVLHFANDDQLIDSDFSPMLIALCVAYIQCWVQHMLPVLHPSFVMMSMDAKMLTGANTSEVSVTQGLGAGQASSVDALPSFCAAKVEKFTAKGGKSGRGRMYLPCATENRTTLSTLDADAQTAINAFLACIAGKFVGAQKTEPWEIGVLSRKNSLLGTIPPDQRFNGVTAFALSPVIAIMGRRKVGVGS